VIDLVYLYNPAIKPGLSKKFCKKWTGPYKVVTSLSDLNYKIVDQQNKKLLVHVNRLKPNYSPQTWKPKLKQKDVKNLPKKPLQVKKKKSKKMNTVLEGFH